jgi:hypothetical protein
MAFLSIECLVGKNHKPVIKEVAFTYYEFKNGTREQKMYSFLVKPPYPKSELTSCIQGTNHWVTNKIHGIKWEHGEFPYDKISETVFSLTGNNVSFYSKGAENCILLSSILNREVFNLEVIGCPKIKDIDALIKPGMRGHTHVHCDWNHKKKSCALNKCLKYEYWVNELRFAEGRMRTIMEIDFHTDARENKVHLVCLGPS